MKDATQAWMCGLPGKCKLAFRKAGITSNHRFAFGKRGDLFQVFETVRRARLDHINHTFGAALAIGEDDLCRLPPPFDIVSA